MDSKNNVLFKKADSDTIMKVVQIDFGAIVEESVTFFDLDDEENVLESNAVSTEEIQIQLEESSDAASSLAKVVSMGQHGFAIWSKSSLTVYNIEGQPDHPKIKQLNPIVHNNEKVCLIPGKDQQDNSKMIFFTSQEQAND